MGVTEQRLVLRVENVDLTTLGISELRRSVRASAGDWSFGRLDQLLPPASFERIIQDVGSVTGEPALGVEVQDSDFAYVVAIEPTEVSAALVLNPKSAEDYAEGRWALERCVQFGTLDWQIKAAEGIARWSRFAPNRVSPSDILDMLHRDWLYAEEGVDVLLGMLGLTAPLEQVDPRFDEALTIEDRGKANIGGKSLDPASQRYVLGYGVDFIGIWDRESPGAPIRRFPFSRFLDAHQEWFRLVLGREEP